MTGPTAAVSVDLGDLATSETSAIFTSGTHCLSGQTVVVIVVCPPARASPQPSLSKLGISKQPPETVTEPVRLMLYSEPRPRDAWLSQLRVGVSFSSFGYRQREFKSTTLIFSGGEETPLRIAIFHRTRNPEVSSGLNRQGSRKFAEMAVNMAVKVAALLTREIGSFRHIARARNDELLIGL